MNIVLICSEYPPRPHGGIGTFVQTLARALTARGHKVTVVGIGETGDTSDGNIRIIMLPHDKKRFVGNAISRLRLWRFLSSAAKAGKIDVIEVPDFEGLLPLRVRGCCTVVRLHVSMTAICLEAGLKIPKGISFYERRTLRANPTWVGVSQYILDSTQEIFRVLPRRSVKIYNPAPPLPSKTLEAPILPENFVLYAGALSKRKGALALAEAARCFLPRHPSLHLVYVGGEIMQPGIGCISELVLKIVGPELALRVHFLGRVDREQVLATMKRARIFVCPSYLEALPLVMLEAMGCGLPVVCTTYPPGPEIIEDGVNGLLADPSNPREFSQAIDRLLDDPSFALHIAENARCTIDRRFSLERCVNETEAFYRECSSS